MGAPVTQPGKHQVFFVGKVCWEMRDHFAQKTGVTVMLSLRWSPNPKQEETKLSRDDWMLFTQLMLICRCGLQFVKHWHCPYIDIDYIAIAAVACRCAWLLLLSFSQNKNGGIGIEIEIVLGKSSQMASNYHLIPPPCHCQIQLGSSWGWTQ